MNGNGGRRIAVCLLIVLAVAARPGRAGNLITLTGTTNEFRGAAQDAAFSGTTQEGNRQVGSLPYAARLNVTSGLSSSANQFDLTDSRFSITFHHALSGYADAFVASAGQVAFTPTADLHYEVAGVYSVTGPAGHPCKIDQDLFLTGAGSSVTPMEGTNQGQSNADGTTTTYTAGTDAGTSHAWQGSTIGTLWSGQKYQLYYQNYISSPAAGVAQGATADGALTLNLWLRGDLDGDRAVGFSDLVALAQHYNSAVGPGGYALGDIDGDGLVTFEDLIILAQHYDTAVPANGIPLLSPESSPDLDAASGVVPEPAVGALTALIVACVVCRRR